MEGVDLQQQHSAQPLVQRADAAGRRRRRPAAGRARRLPYPQSPNPNNWYTFNYGTQRNTWGGNGEFSGKTPWFIRADYNEVKTNGIKPGSGQLGTGSGNGLIELGIPVEYKTQNTTIEGGYNTRQYGFKVAFLDSKFTDANDVVQWTNFYMRSGLDYSLLPPDNELKKWAFNGYIKQLPWDSAIIARFTQSKLDEQLRHRVDKPQADGEHALRPMHPARRGQPRDAAVRRRLDQNLESNFNGNIKTTTANVAWNAARWRSSTRGFTTTTTTCRTTRPACRTGGQPGQQLRESAGQQRDVLHHRRARRAGGCSVHEELGGIRRNVVVQPLQQAARRL